MPMPDHWWNPQADCERLNWSGDGNEAKCRQWQRICIQLLDCATSPHKDVESNRSNGSPFSAQQKECEWFSSVIECIFRFCLFFRIAANGVSRRMGFYAHVYMLTCIYVYTCYICAGHKRVKVRSRFMNMSWCANNEPETAYVFVKSPTGCCCSLTLVRVLCVLFVLAGLHASPALCCVFLQRLWLLKDHLCL